MQGSTRVQFLSIVEKNLAKKYCTKCDETMGGLACTDCRRTKLLKEVIVRANYDELFDDPILLADDDEDDIIEIKTEIKQEFNDVEERIKAWRDYYADAHFFPQEDVVKEKEIDAKGFLGRTPLHVAVIENNLDEVKNLVRRGANLEAMDNSEMTPYELAVVEEKTDIINFFESLHT